MTVDMTKRPLTWADVTVGEFAAMRLVQRPDAAALLDWEYGFRFATGAYPFADEAPAVSAPGAEHLASWADELAACHSSDVRGAVSVARRVLHTFGVLAVLHAADATSTPAVTPEAAAANVTAQAARS